MKVVYVTVEATIRKAIRAADANGREISHIELSRFEAAQLAIELAQLNFASPSYSITTGDHYMGVRLEVKE